MSGYMGKILRVNLSNRKLSTIDTKDYEQWVGGHGMGSAIFWDLVKDKAISGYDSRNVITIMTSPLSGTLVPGASGRTEVQGIGIQSYPIEWFTRSNFGGRFGAMLKYAGWDGIVIEGKADKPVWVDIREGDVQIRDSSHLWGLDAWETQKEIWHEVSGKEYGNWMQLNVGRTTQRPAVLTIGPAGERLSRTASLIHDAGNASGQGGFGGVWGSKNLKAISVIGTASVKISDPNALIETRLWATKNYGMNLENPRSTLAGWSMFGGSCTPLVAWQRPKQARPQACIGCHAGCRGRHSNAYGNESSCAEAEFYSHVDLKKHSGRQTSAAYIAADLLQRYGINAYEAWKGLLYIRDLNKMDVLGQGKHIDCDLPFDMFGTDEFVNKFLRMIAYREGIGDDFAEGFFRAAKRWGRLEEDLKTGLLPYPYWGLPLHYDPRVQIEWGYGTILGDRDINEHAFNVLFWWPSSALWAKKEPLMTAENVTKIFSEKLIPYEGDPLMMDFSTDNIYSEHICKLVAWHRHYTRFWEQSVLYCDVRWPDIINANAPDGRGITGEGEPKFLNAVTGKNYAFVDGMELGRKIWNLDNAIWTLQGRHRDMVHFAEYIYKVPWANDAGLNIDIYYLPGREKEKWKYVCVNDRYIDRAKFEEWKSKFYKFEGWDPSTGWPNRNTLESQGLGYVADELEKNGKLGGAQYAEVAGTI